MLYRVKLGSVYVSNSQDHRLDLSAGGAAYACCFGAQAGDLGAGDLDAFHDGALNVDGWERYVKATQFFAVDIRLADNLAAQRVNLLAPDRAVDNLNQEIRRRS